MRFSELFPKPRKTAPADVESVNARLLIQGGFVDQVTAGVYTWMPLGLRVLRKVQQIVREEMNAVGGQEIVMPVLHPKQNWETTGRWGKMTDLFKTKSATGKEYALGPTHEEIITPLVKSFVQSYKDLPLALYQIQTKLRDELRPKSGVLRGREFEMKDLYSFHRDRDELTVFYEKVIGAYRRIFERIGVAVRMTQASGGAFTEKYSHEFHVLTPAGEDVLLICASCPFAQNKEISKLSVGSKCPDCGGRIEETKGIEVGNIFDLGTRFAEAFDLAYTDEHGKRLPVVMGCYGLGTTRTVGAVVEASHDDKGIIWPKAVAPFDAHLVVLKSDAQSDHLIRDLEKAGLSVLVDDRPDATAGSKFADADLIGIPTRLVISEKTLAKDSVEYKERAASAATLIPLSKVAGLFKT